MSTEKFVRLLQQGDYSLLLKWLKFLEARYSLRPEELSADTLIPIMVFELSNHGFCLDDLIHIEILNAVLNSPGSALPGRMECALAFLISAGLQYQVYADYQLLSFYQTTSLLDGVAVQQWMLRDNLVLNNRANSDALQRESERLQATVPNYQLNAEKIKTNIFTIVASQNLCQQYLCQLGKADKADKQLAVRIGVVHAMNDYLQSEFILTEKFTPKLTGFVNKIRELAPFAWEEEYLSGFFEQTLVQKLSMEVSRRFRFFAVQVFDHFISDPAVNVSVEDDEIEMVEFVTHQEAVAGVLSKLD